MKAYGKLEVHTDRDTDRNFAGGIAPQIRTHYVQTVLTGVGFLQRKM